MTTTLHETDAGQRSRRFIAPVGDHRVGATRPIPVGLCDVHGSVVECTAPADHRAHQVGVAAGDRGEATQSLNLGNGIRIDVARRLPEQIAATGLDQHRLMADADIRRDDHPVQSRFDVNDGRRGARLPQPLRSRPALSGDRHILPLVIADHTPGGRHGCVFVLESAGGADPQCHFTSSVISHPVSFRLVGILLGVRRSCGIRQLLDSQRKGDIPVGDPSGVVRAEFE